MYKTRLQKVIRFLSLFIGVISGTILALNFFIERTASSGPKGPKGFAVFAKRDVPKGRTVTRDDIEERLVDKDRIPEDVVTRADEAKGKITKEDIQCGQLISRFELSASHSKP